ncbi:hypothetical protein AB670_00013 [Chryseobacterium sp. MOF25P]|uniref:hypothetical protein n=1 Tax=unclassified Chryseobacterium TaxID=2593645 RepID=UPI000804ECB2|nr:MULTISPECIES: hypothetical protein [unclassified Chryseobacterium]OBW43484.1 hypothetical protein AB670_00013 [Chryseobacterium sp. MOF25P]OBW46742.1 hypothetical protein AB671_01238 [Chryseobacterium sp. BGARF1]
MENKNIFKSAVKLNLCREWQEKMKNDSSLESLCKMYFAGDDWSMENDFPNLETLRAFKGKSDVFGIHTDFIGSNVNEFEAAYFGDSDVNLNYNKYSVGKLILRHNTKAKIQTKDNAVLFINLLDNAEVEIECLDKALVNVFCYGNQNLKSIGNVKVQSSTFKK